MSSSDSKKGEIPKLQQKDDNTDFHVFLSEIWKLCNNRQTADYALTIGRLPIIESTADYRPINRTNRLIGSSLIYIKKLQT